MSDETVFQSVATSVTVTPVDGVVVAVGATPVAATTFVSVVPAWARSYHDTSSRPELSAFRSAGRKCSPPTLALRRTGPVAAVRVPSVYDCMRMSPSGWKRLSFQTIDTVLNGRETAIRGKSCGKPVKPGMTADAIDVTLTAAVFAGPPPANGNARLAYGMRATTFRTGSTAQGPAFERLVAMLCS